MKVAPNLTPAHARALQARVAGVVAIAALVIVADTVFWMVRSWSPLPFWDQWESIFEYMILRDEGPQASQLFGQHNEHRLVFPRLLFLADIAAFGASNRLLISLLFVIQAAHAGVLIALSRPKPTSWAAYAAVSSVVVALMLSMMQAENLIWGFQVQFVGVFACASGANLLLLKAVERQRLGRRWIAPLTGTLALLLVAVFTMANGIVAAILTVPLSLLLRASWRIIAVLVAAIATYALAFFHGYHSPVGEGLIGLADHPIAALRYVALYLGNVIAPIWQNGPVASVLLFGPLLVGAVGLVLLGLATLRSLSEKAPDGVRSVLLTVMMFAVASAVLTASGRIGMGLESAFTTRYSTPSAIFWAAQLLYWHRVWAARKGSSAATVAACVVFVALLAVVQVRIRPVLIDHVQRVSLATDALLTGVDDWEAMVGVFSRPADVKPRAQFLQDHRLSIFATAEAGWKGRRVSEIAQLVGDGRCAGAVDAVEAPPEAEGGALRLMGWSWDMDRERAPRRLLIADRDGAVVGFASSGSERPDVAQAWKSPRMASSGWRGYALAKDGEQLTAYLLLGDGKACALGSAQAPNAGVAQKLDPTETGKLGSALPVAVNLTDRFIPNGLHVSAGAAPETAYGSGRVSDGDQGEVTFGPFSPMNDRIGLAIITGPNTGGQTLAVTDAVTGAVISQLTPKVRAQWTWVTMRVPAGRLIRLTVSDRGSGWGQWIAVTLPHDAPEPVRADPAAGPGG